MMKKGKELKSPEGWVRVWKSFEFMKNPRFPTLSTGNPRKL
jgi:hypothetical protein